MTVRDPAWSQAQRKECEITLQLPRFAKRKLSWREPLRSLPIVAMDKKRDHERAHLWRWRRGK